LPYWLGLILFLALAACGGPLSLLTGGGPNVAANVQAGKTNSQTIGQTTNTSQKLVRPNARTIEQSTGPTRVRTERVETIVVNEKVPEYLWFLWAITVTVALFLDSPRRWPGQIIGLFKRQAE